MVDIPYLLGLSDPQGRMGKCADRQIEVFATQL